MIWTRQRQTNQLRSTLREFYPGALTCLDDLDGGDAVAVLAMAPTPVLGRALSRSKIAAALRRGGRQRRVDERTEEIQASLRTAQLAAPSAASGNFCALHKRAKCLVIGMAVPPGDVAANHSGLGSVGLVVGAVEGEVAQRAELGLDAVEP